MTADFRIAQGPTFIIAEAGVNHDGSPEKALALVDAAFDAGADAVKFQTFTSASLVTREAPKAGYQVETTGEAGTQADMLARLELDRDAHVALMQRCRTLGIEFLSSPFDLASIDLLAGLGVRTFKVPSGEITNLPYLRRIGATQARVLLSTGMSTLAEVRAAVDVLLVSGISREDLVVLQCTTAYPAPLAEANLRAMVTMRDELDLAVGYSDHTPGDEAALAAVALGARVVEKHFTLDKSAPGPDHRASLEPGEFASLVCAIRGVESALGDGVKRPAPSELANLAVARKSIVAARAIAVGEPFSEENVTVKRPAGGIDPMRWDEVVGAVAPRDFAADEGVEL